MHVSSISVKRLVWCLVASAVATFVAGIIAFLVALYVPFISGPEEAQSLPPGKTLTLEELNQADREARERMKRRKEQFDRETLSERVEEIKRRGLPISWLPWILLPFVFRLKQPLELLPLVIVPAALLLTPLVIIWELVTYVAALLVGAVAAMLVLRRSSPARSGEQQT